MDQDLGCYVFIDESGTTDLADQDGSSRFYVAAAIVVEKCNIEKVNSAIDAISMEFNNGKPLKSSKIGGNIDRRLKLLHKVESLPFQFLGLALDKKKVDRSSGLRFRQVFYKNVNKRLYELVSKNTIGSVHAIVDSYGDSEYQKSAEEYFQRIGTLFHPIEISVVDDSSQRLVQLADIIAGSLRIWLSSIPMSNNKIAELRDLLNKKKMLLQCWPPIYSEPRTISINLEGDEIDQKIEAVMLDKACRLIEEYEDSDDDDDIRKAEVLKYLIEARVYGKYVYCDKLIDAVNRQCEKKVGRKAFLSNVIGAIRKEGIIITGTNKGYRLATTINDVKAYLQQDKTVILPMLTKLRCARLLLSTSANIDILLGKDNKELVACLNAIENVRISSFVSNDEIDDEKIIPVS